MASDSGEIWRRTMRVPAKAALRAPLCQLFFATAMICMRKAGNYTLANEMGISLLLVGQGIEMLFDFQSYNGGRGVGQVVLEIGGVHVCERCTEPERCNRLIRSSGGGSLQVTQGYNGAADFVSRESLESSQAASRQGRREALH